MNGHNTTLSGYSSLNTSNTTIGIQFTGTNTLTFANNNGLGVNPGGTATVYTRLGIFDALNTSGGTLANTTDNTGLVVLNGSQNLVGKTLNLQNLTFNANGVSATMLSSNGTVNFNAYSAMDNVGTAFSQGTFDFGPTAIYRIGSDARLVGGATWIFQTGSMVSIAYSPENTNTWGVPSNVDLVLSTNTGTITPTGTAGITLGNGRTLSSPWNATGRRADSLFQHHAQRGPRRNKRPPGRGQRPDTHGQRPAAVGQCHLEHQRHALQHVLRARQRRRRLHTAARRLALERHGAAEQHDEHAQRGFRGFREERHVAAGQHGALGSGPAMTVGASTANATTATLDLNANNLAVSSLNGSALGVVTNSSTAAAAALMVSVPASTTSTYAGKLTNGTQALSLNVAGPGTLALIASSNYTGGTTLSAGMLVLGNTSGSALGSGNLAFSGGTLATFAGSAGSLSGSVIAGGNNYITPGGDNAIGTLGVGGLTLNNLSTMRFDIAGPSSFDQVNDSGPLGFSSGTGVATLLVPANVSSGTYGLINFGTTALTNTSDFSLQAIGGGTLGGYSLVLTGTQNAQLDLVVGGSAAPSGPAVWQGTLSPSWTNANNWSSTGVPSGNGVLATVGSATATPTTITLDSPQTLGQLTLSATNAATGYTLAAGYAGALVMSNTNNQAVILVPSGSHSITAPVILAGALSIQPTAGMTLNILGNISEMSVGSGSLSLDGPGTLILGGSDSYTGGTTLTAGTLIATSSSSLAAGTNLTVGGGSTFIFDPSQSAAPAAGGGATLAAAPAGAVAAVPEPGTLALFGAAGLVVGVGAWRRRRKGR